MESLIVLQEDEMWGWIPDHDVDCWTYSPGDENYGVLANYTHLETGQVIGAAGSLDENGVATIVRFDENTGQQLDRCWVSSAQLFQVPTSGAIADIREYNASVMSIIIFKTIDVRLWDYVSRWWEPLIIEYELSEETLVLLAQKLEALIKAEINRQENEERYLFGFDKYDLATYFGVSGRTALAIMRLVGGEVYMGDVEYLDPIMNRLAEGGDIRTGIGYLAQHPKGEVYHGDLGEGGVFLLITLVAAAIITGGFASTFFGPAAAGGGAAGGVAPTAGGIGTGFLGTGIQTATVISALKTGFGLFTMVAGLNAAVRPGAMSAGVRPSGGAVQPQQTLNPTPLVTPTGTIIDPTTNQPIGSMTGLEIDSGTAVMSIGAVAAAAYMFLK